MYSKHSTRYSLLKHAILRETDLTSTENNSSTTKNRLTNTHTCTSRQKKAKMEGTDHISFLHALIFIPLPASLRLYWDHNLATLWLKSTWILRSSINALSICTKKKKTENQSGLWYQIITEEFIPLFTDYFFEHYLFVWKKNVKIKQDIQRGFDIKYLQDALFI